MADAELEEGDGVALPAPLDVEAHHETVETPPMDAEYHVDPVLYHGAFHRDGGKDDIVAIKGDSVDGGTLLSTVVKSKQRT